MTSTRLVDHDTSSHAPELRRRADHLVGLAADIEHALVLRLPDVVAAQADGWNGPRARLCDHMLETNLHQLHRAADELRHTAMRFRQRADDLEAALRPAS